MEEIIKGLTNEVYENYCELLQFDQNESLSVDLEVIDGNTYEWVYGIKVTKQFECNNLIIGMYGSGICYNAPLFDLDEEDETLSKINDLITRFIEDQNIVTVKAYNEKA